MDIKTDYITPPRSNLCVVKMTSSCIPVNRPEFGGTVPILSTVSRCSAKGTNVLNFREPGCVLPQGRFSYTHRAP